MKEDPKKISAELKGLSPLLSKLKNQEHGQKEVPEGYFDSFEQRLMAKMKGASEEAPTETKVVVLPTKAWKWRPQYAIAIAASFLILVLTATWWVRGNAPHPLDYQLLANMDIEKELNAIPLAEADAYVLENIDNIDSEILTAQLDEASINSWSSNNASIINITPIDTVVPPPINKQNPIVANKDSKSPIQEPSFKENLEDEILNDTDLNDLLGDLSDSDLDALEAALLKKPLPTKKENPVKPK